MALTVCRDRSVADWLVGSDTDPQRLITFGPAGFDAYARLRFIPDPTTAGEVEADVQVGATHPRDIDQARRALRLLGRFSTTPDEWFFCVWDGYSDIVLPEAAPRLTDLPHRQYVVLQGGLDDLDAWDEQLGFGLAAPPAFAWPADRACCFASDVDPHWAGIGGARPAIDGLVRDELLDVVGADPSASHPAYA